MPTGTTLTNTHSFNMLRFGIKILPVAIVCFLFANTLGSVINFAQALDRVTAERVSTATRF